MLILDYCLGERRGRSSGRWGSRGKSGGEGEEWKRRGRGRRGERKVYLGNENAGNIKEEKERAREKRKGKTLRGGGKER